MKAAPYRCGVRLESAAFARVRRALVLDHCKWDPQVGDVATLADFPLLLPAETWSELARSAEQLALEATEAELELSAKPDLLERLGLPRRLRRVLESRGRRIGIGSTPRSLRFDFHFARDGWRISECNADVPGGYAEASAFPDLMAAHYPGAKPAGDPGGAWAEALARAAGGSDVALLSAAGFMEDHQVTHYLAKRVEALGVRAECAQPAQIEWRAGRAYLAGRSVGALMRFYQAEWLTNLPHSSEWWHYFGAAETPVLNPGSCITIESKRFPLVWDALASDLSSWRRLLPHSVDPREAPFRDDDSWLLKTALCNTGDTVSGRALVSPARWTEAARSARWFPRNWVAQRRFEPVPLETPLGPVFPCIGVYTIDGSAAGAYARLSRGPIVDFTAIDVALLVENSGHAAVA